MILSKSGDSPFDVGISLSIFFLKKRSLTQEINPNVAKAGGLQSQEELLSKIKLDASSRKAGASEGEVVVFYPVGA